MHLTNDCSLLGVVVMSITHAVPHVRVVVPWPLGAALTLSEKVAQTRREIRQLREVVSELELLVARQRRAAPPTPAAADPPPPSVTRPETAWRQSRRQ